MFNCYNFLTDVISVSNGEETEFVEKRKRNPKWKKIRCVFTLCKMGNDKKVSNENVHVFHRGIRNIKP